MTSDFYSLFPSINKVSGTGKIRSKPEDFKVIEHNDIELTGSGEHLWLFIEKTNSNTAWVATQISSACKVPARQVGYAGLKDRHAVTQQWFSVQLPKIRDLDEIKSKLPPEISIIRSQWHKSKIKTGFLDCNEFNLIIRDFQGNRSQLEENLTAIKINGVPNYFGAQRFGHDMNNVQKVHDWFSDKIRVNNKNLRSLLISTARSHLFNLIVAHRIKNGSWNEVLKGDVLQLNDSHSWFPESQGDAAEMAKRLEEFDIHLTAALWGEDAVQSSGICAELETTMAQKYPVYQQGFEKFRVKQDRRSMRINPLNLEHHWQQDTLHLSFKLQPGAYATCVLKEILKVTEQIE